MKAFVSKISLIVILLLAVAYVPFTQAATLTVSNLSDSGSGSLRQAITDAASGDTINFSVTGTIILTSGELNIDKDLTIEGPGVNELSISGNNSSRVINIYSWGIPGGVVLTVSNITISNGNVTSSGGGGIRIWSDDKEPSTLDLNNVNVINNKSEYYGGGIQISSGIVTIKNSNISGNNLCGISNGYGTLNIINSTISNNVGHRAGGIRNLGTANVTNSLISNNSAGLGGGIVNDYGTLTITNSTISHNEAYDVLTLATWGGGIANWDTLFLINSTITENTAEEGGDGIYNRGTVTLSNSIIANNSPHSDCYNYYGNLTSLGYNLDTDGTCDLTQSTDIPSTNPLLGALADNGGPTKTHALLVGSPAIDSGEQNCIDGNGSPLLTDQRGESRPVDGDSDGFAACDIGSYEVQPLGTIIVSIDILPKLEVNTINLNNKGSIQVAILSTSDFLAYNEVNPDSVAFGPAGADATRYKMKDVNRDGLLDILFYFKIKETGIECGHTETTLVGETFDGNTFEGTDSIVTKGCRL